MYTTSLSANAAYSGGFFSSLTFLFPFAIGRHGIGSSGVPDYQFSPGNPSRTRHFLPVGSPDQADQEPQESGEKPGTPLMQWVM